jgi:hypothetical protein
MLGHGHFVADTEHGQVMRIRKLRRVLSRLDALIGEAGVGLKPLSMS